MIQKKHAYLIMAHNNFYCLEKLIKLLDDPRNDIFLHIDAKVKNFDFDYFRSLCKKSNLIYTKKRINVRWGTQSQVKTEMLLFQKAARHGPHHYYHLISGSDLPMKTQKEIQEFFATKTECFITIHEDVTVFDYQRISRYHGVFGRNGLWSKRLNAYSAIVQEKLGIDRLRRLQPMLVKRGWNWVSLPQNAVDLLLEKRRFINELTAYSICADEIYKQIVLLNTDRKDISICENRSCLRLVDWERREKDHPHIFTVDDFEMLRRTPMLFARKFDEKTDKQIIDMVYCYIKSKQQEDK